MNAELKEKIAQCRKNNWYEVEFSIEALAINKDVVETSLRQHVEKLEHIRELVVFETRYEETQEVEKPLKHVEKAFSQIVFVKLFVKNLVILTEIVMLFGPSAIEVLGPKQPNIEIGEIQNMLNSVAGLVHRFASAGAGGIVMTPEKK